jgi:DNA-directed RNA polymerase delta subunit
MTSERKILRKIFGPVIEDNQRRSELEELYSDVNIGTFIKLYRLRWLRHVLRIVDARNTSNISSQPTQRRSKRRPKARWEDDVEDDLRTMGVVNWRQTAQDRDGWSTPVEAIIFLGKWSH